MGWCRGNKAATGGTEGPASCAQRPQRSWNGLFSLALHLPTILQLFFIIKQMNYGMLCLSKPPLSPEGVKRSQSICQTSYKGSGAPPAWSQVQLLGPHRARRHRGLTRGQRPGRVILRVNGSAPQVGPHPPFLFKVPGTRDARSSGGAGKCVDH